MPLTPLLISLLTHVPALAAVTLRRRCRVGGLDLEVPWTATTRLSIVAGNMRMHRLMDRVVRPGTTVVDVGANIGYHTAYLAERVGPTGRVIALEPAADNVAVLRRQLVRNRLTQVTVHECAAGQRDESRELYLRGPVSGVNSLYPDSCYGAVTGRRAVPVVRLDTLIQEPVDTVKIDVEGAELDVLRGMPRLLEAAALTLLVEWHPVLQVAAGEAAEALPRFLLAHDFTLTAAWHTGESRIDAAGVSSVAARLVRRQRSVELLARR